MKIAALALALSIAMPSIAFAQTADHGHEKAETRPFHSAVEDGKAKHGKIANQLGLSDAQKEAAKLAFRQGHEERKQIKEKYIAKLSEADREAMKAELKQAKEARHQAFLQILTPEQQEKASFFRSKHKEAK